MADDDDQRREWERLKRGKARRDFESAGRDVKDKPRDGGTRGIGDRDTGQPPPSKPELDRLKEDRKRDYQRGPAPAPRPKGPGGRVGQEEARRKFEQDQQKANERAQREQYVSERLERMKGRARDDFDRSR